MFIFYILLIYFFYLIYILYLLIKPKNYLEALKSFNFVLFSDIISKIISYFIYNTFFSDLNFLTIIFSFILFLILQSSNFFNIFLLFSLFYVLFIYIIYTYPITLKTILLAGLISIISYLFTILNFKNKEFRRKIFHIILFFFLGLFLQILPNISKICLLITALICIFIYFLRNKINIIIFLYDSIGRGRKDKGFLWGVLSMALLSFIWDKAYIAAYYMAFTDGFATIFGKSFFNTNKKSLIGLLGGFLGGLLAALISNTGIFFTFLIALFEYLIDKKYIDDNLLLPFIIYLLYKLLYSSAPVV